MEDKDYNKCRPGYETNLGLELEKEISEILISEGKKKKVVVGILFGSGCDKIKNLFDNSTEFTKQSIPGSRFTLKKIGL